MFTFKRDIRLHTTIIWLFVLLTLPAIAILVVVNYKVNTRVIEDYSRKFIEKSVNDNINTTTGLLNPIINSVKYAATLVRVSHPWAPFLPTKSSRSTQRTA